MHWNRSFILISIALILSGCYSKEDQNKKVVQEWYGKTVVIPSSLKPKVAGRDTTISASEILDKDYNVLTFVDTTGCTECNLRLYDWRLLIEEVKQYSKEINFIFVIHSSNFERSLPLRLRINSITRCFTIMTIHLPKRTKIYRHNLNFNLFYWTMKVRLYW